MNENLVKENTKTLWARVGVSITVSDSEYNNLVDAVKAGEASRADAIVENWLTNGNVELSGETYFLDKDSQSGYDNSSTEDIDWSFLF